MRNLILMLYFFASAAWLAPPAAAGPLFVTEVVTDPQADHSESSGGNGVAYDTIPGDGAISSVDEFVELYNGGGLAIDLTGYRIEFADSSPSDFEFGADNGALYFSEGSTLESLAPEGFVVLGNPPGALNNAIDITLFDPAGDAIDFFAVEDGNATSLLDEAVARNWDGVVFRDDFQQLPISPGALPAPVPEPAGSFLAAVGAILITVLRASARRASPDRRRRGAA